MKALDGSKKRVIQCEEELAVIDKKVKELKGIFATKTGEAQVLKNELERSQATLLTARNLLSKL
jgi:dynein heavy chain 2